MRIGSLVVGALIGLCTQVATSQAAGIVGYVDSVTQTADRSALIRGWACDQGAAKSIAIHVYLGGPADVGKFYTGLVANAGNEPAVNSACGTSGVSHRFAITVPAADVNLYGGQFVYVHGISVTGGSNLQLNNSGRFPIHRNDAPAVVAACPLSVYQALASSSGEPVNVNCHLNLKPTDVVKNLILVQGRTYGSNVTINCNGAVLEKGLIIASTKIINPHTQTPDWKPPQNVRVSGCTSRGMVRITGMGVNGEDPNLTSSSRMAFHTERARYYAPSFITLTGMHFEANGSIPLYLSPGVNNVTVERSIFSGTSVSVAIYMDGESGFNKILNNMIQTQTTKRELIAIDGSANNLISGNHFAALNHGGIFIYRNCGEGGNIRHQTPNNNVITGNHFYYHYYRGPLPSVWIASRNGNRSYCGLDSGYPFGSSANNRDLAMFNTVSDNTYDSWFSVRVDETNNTVANNLMISK